MINKIKYVNPNYVKKAEQKLKNFLEGQQSSYRYCIIAFNNQENSVMLKKHLDKIAGSVFRTQDYLFFELQEVVSKSVNIYDLIPLEEYRGKPFALTIEMGTKAQIVEMKIINLMRYKVENTLPIKNVDGMSFFACL